MRLQHRGINDLGEIWSKNVIQTIFKSVFFLYLGFYITFFSEFKPQLRIDGKNTGKEKSVKTIIESKRSYYGFYSRTSMIVPGRFIQWRHQVTLQRLINRGRENQLSEPSCYWQWQVARFQVLVGRKRGHQAKISGLRSEKVFVIEFVFSCCWN